MVVVSPPAKVLVTGANGYIAVWICRILLEQGYSVRGTVRTDSKGKYLKDMFKSSEDKFEYLVVGDMTKDGAFDEAVKGVDGVLHTASPLSMDVDHPDDIINPAVQGTVTVLNSILKAGSDVRRVVLTSSCASILEPRDPGHVYTEEDWNEFSITESKEKVEKAAPIHKYRASKTLAEKAAWDFVAKHKDSIKWQLVAILPPYAFGPLLQETPTKDHLNFSVEILYKAATEEKPAEELYGYAGNWVDVRDIALAHILALQKEEAGGERLIVSAGHFAWQDLYDGLHTFTPPLPGVPRGKPSDERGPMLVYSSDKAKKILGIKLRTLAESAQDTIISVRERVHPAPVTVGDGPAGMTLEDVEPAD